MISASKEFKEKLKKGANVVNYADITLSDGTVLHLEPKDFMIGGCVVEDKTTDGKFGVGFVIGKTVSIKIANHDERFSQYDFYKSIIHLYVALALDNGTVEKIRKGVYYTLVPESPGDIIEISAVDGMYQLDKDYASSTTVYPAILQTIISEACGDCGIPVGFGRFDNMDFIVGAKPEKTTYRQVVSWAAQIAGYNARIDNAGYMQLVWYDTDMLSTYAYDGGNFKVYPHDTVIDGGNFKDYSTDTVISGGSFTDKRPEHIYQIKPPKVCTDDVQITGVKVYGEEEEFTLFGEEGYLIEVKDNPFTAGKEAEVADYLGARIVGMMFRPFSAEALGNPLLEPFDVVRFPDRKGNEFISLLNSVTYTVGSYTQIACEAEDPVRNGSVYHSDAAAAVVEARRETDKQITEYDKAVQSMNELAANSFGLFFEKERQENGGYIFYESTRPITVDENGKCHFEDGSYVWMRSDNGFFVSQDGGKTYTSGFDKNSNAVVNVLYAIGIVADWIRTGRFTVKKGDTTTFLADADTGEVKIVADEFSLSSGDTIESIAEDKSNSALNIAKEFTKGEIQAYSSQVDSSFTLVNDRISAEVTRATKAEGTLDGSIKTVNENLSSKIDQTAENITSTVSKTYESKSNATIQYNSLSSKIDQTANNINLSVSSTYETKNDATTKYSSFESRLTITEGKIESKVSKGDVSSQISQEAGKISIRSNRLSITSDNFKLTESGSITATSGTIGGFTIGARALKGTNSDGSNQIVALQVPGDNMVFAIAVGTQTATSTGGWSYGNCAFRVSKTGKLYATNATITGDVTANNLYVGGRVYYKTGTSWTAYPEHTTVRVAREGGGAVILHFADGLYWKYDIENPT